MRIAWQRPSPSPPSGTPRLAPSTSHFVPPPAFVHTVRPQPFQGWHIAAELAACCLWLVRIEVRRLDHAGAGATELRGVMRAQLRKESQPLHQLMALMARASDTAREKGRASGKALGTPPQVMIRVPYSEKRP